MLYGCNCASVGVPLKTSNRSTPVTPGSASIWPCNVLGGPPMSAYAISTWNEPGVHVGLAVGVGVGDCPPPPQQKRSVELVGTPVLSYPPASQMRQVPSVSVGKLRRPVPNAGTGVFAAQVLVAGS